MEISPETTHTTLTQEEWRELAGAHREAVEAVTIPMRKRKSRQEKHPVYDFLHTYYSFSLGRLERWHPGVGIVLEGGTLELFPERSYRYENGSCFADPSLLTAKGRDRLKWMRKMLLLTQGRSPILSCYGLHEWAMVYEGDDVRHRESAPLRLSQEDVDEVVKSRPICCSHFDAFRFFTKNAIPLNRLDPSLHTREEHEQPGCIHANMDLYKWAYKSSPWISSELLRETLFFAIEAREVDMRASPYDLEDYGYEPICIETGEGRQEYEKHQRALYEKGIPIRARLIEELTAVLSFGSEVYADS